MAAHFYSKCIFHFMAFAALHPRSSSLRFYTDTPPALPASTSCSPFSPLLTYSLSVRTCSHCTIECITLSDTCSCSFALAERARTHTRTQQAAVLIGTMYDQMYKYNFVVHTRTARAQQPELKIRSWVCLLLICVLKMEWVSK